MRYALILVVLGAVLTFSAVGAGAVIGPATPSNLEVVAVTQDSITLAWGPSQPGPFYNAGEGKNYVMVAWGLSTDTRGPVTYELQKNDAVIATGLTTNTYRVSVPPGKKTTSFRACVTAQLADGRRSAPTCGTWSR